MFQGIFRSEEESLYNSYKSRATGKISSRNIDSGSCSANGFRMLKIALFGTGLLMNVKIPIKETHSSIKEVKMLNLVDLYGNSNSEVRRKEVTV